MDKNFNPQAEEAHIYEHWEKNNHFACGQKPEAETYTIVIPPPNITGSLHIGHALNNTLQDILVRRKRMQGYDVLWQPGTDHASIATQMVVERQLREQGLPNRHELGRGKFLEKVWEWKEVSGNHITEQLKRIGCSCDWERERFTMDEGLSHSVRHTFVELYNQGLIYKDNRLVNWDPVMETAISDLEVIPKEVDGHEWHIQYPLKDNPNETITVATTRPETMLGDVAVAVNPNDPRYQHLIGKKCILPIVGRELLIVGDDYADPEQGSGAVKITPAHDFNDFEVGKRHNLELIPIMDRLARIQAPAPEEYCGLDRFVAREKIVTQLKEIGALVKIEAIKHTVPYGERGGVPVEPILTEQWYVNAEVLAQPAIQSVREGRTKFVPENWEKTYYSWMENIQPWCISRQLWWGHQIPAWYGPDQTIFVAMTEKEALEKARAHYGQETEITQDEDVLDTWFSSALWPFSTLGWPHETPEITARHYPTDVLTTGFDIIFFWVARMMMMGLHFMKTEPFHTVYIHALVRDEFGHKMSKSKGNVINPLTLIDEYGADTVRFTLAALAAPGRDIKLATGRVEGYRNFITKLWNASRFALMHDAVGPKINHDDFDVKTASHPLNQWIIGEFIDTRIAIDRAVEHYRFNDAAQSLHHFVWRLFCDWYVEAAKIILTTEGHAHHRETQQTLGWIIDRILRVSHPFIPFVTEKLWRETGLHNTDLMVAQWPQEDADLKNIDASKQMQWIMALIGEIRSARSGIDIPPGLKLPLIASDEISDQHRQWMTDHEPFLLRLARLSDISFASPEVSNSIKLSFDGQAFAILIGSSIDFDKERERITKKLKQANADIDKLKTKLNNEKFISNAPPEVIEKNKGKMKEHEANLVILNESLAKLGP